MGNSHDIQLMPKAVSDITSPDTQPHTLSKRIRQIVRPWLQLVRTTNAIYPDTQPQRTNYLSGPILGLVSLIILAGGCLLQFLVILSGTVEHNPLNKVFFLQSTTNGITGAQNPARWTFFAVCGVANGLNANCGHVKPALPFNPVQNFGTSTGVPDAFIGTHKFYYLSRFMFAFYLIALFFAVIALFTGLLALCTRLGAYLSGLNVMIAVFFQALAAALMT